MSSSGGQERAYRSDQLHGRLVHHLGQRIVSGVLAPGTALPTESALVSDLGSSRSAVREATKVLSAKGLVRSKTKVGTIIQPESSWNLLDPDVLSWRYESEPSDQHLRDLAGIRVALEPEAARLAAGARSKKAIAPIREAYLRMEDSIDEPDAFIAHDLAFHHAVVEAGGNELLIHLNDLMAVALAAARQVHTRNVRRNRRTLPAHKAVLDAIAGRDPDRAAALMRDVVRGAQHDISRERRKPDASSPDRPTKRVHRARP